eukprot:gene2444-2678_t
MSISLVSRCCHQVSVTDNNLPLEGIKNIRDLSTALPSIIPKRLYRTGCLSKASPSDLDYLQREGIEFKTLIDLRSDDELEKDSELFGGIYEGFANYFYNRKLQCLVHTGPPLDVSPKKRIYISLMDESLIKREVFKRLRKRHKLLSLFLFGMSRLSRRANRAVRKLFLDYINNGGLPLLNEIVVDASGQVLTQVLRFISNYSADPVAFYCTAGKDRTGLVAMLLLHVLGASEEEILADYEMSDSAYRDLNDSSAMVASLQQSDVDHRIFLRAPREVMAHTMAYIVRKFGSIEAYLDKHGFDASDRKRLRDTLLKK